MSSSADGSAGAFWEDVDTEAALDRYRTLVNTIDDGIYQLDASGRFVAVNETIVELTGYSRDELIGNHVSLVLDAEDVDRIGDRIRSNLVSGSTDIETVSLSIETAAGESIPCELRINLLIEDEQFRGTIGVARNVSEKQERRESLASAEASYETITTVLDEANIGVVVLDDAFEVAWADETIADYLGLDRAAIVGRDSHEFVDETMKYRFMEPERFAETVTAAYDDNSAVERFECRITAGDDRDGQWLEHYSKPIESGQYAGGRIEFYYDITDRTESEGARREAEAEFHSLVDAVEEYAIFRLDEDGYVSSWNEGAREIKGYDRPEILGEHISTFYTADDRSANVPEQNLQRAAETGSIEVEGWRVRKDGSRFWASVTITAIRDADDDLQGYVKVTRDMTDRYEREQELESELEHLFGRISDAFYAVDEEFRFTFVNDQAEDLLQHSESELLGKRLWDVFPDAEEIDAVWDAFQTAMETQTSTSFELYYDTLDFWVEANLYPSETGISVYFRDVTERKRREQQLKKSEQQHRTLAENLPNGIVTMFDEDLEYTLAAGRVFDELPVSPDDVEGRSVREVWPKRVSEALEPAFRAALDGETRATELEYVDREWIVRVVPITDDDGTVFGGMTIAQDITERKARERALEASNERLERFAYAASHDLQEPLRMVSSYLRLIENRYADAFDDDGEEFLAFAIDGADRMREMIEGLLEYSRIEAQGDSFEPVDLNEVVAAVQLDLQMRIDESNAEITTVDLPRVDGDRGQLRQLFQNLLSNAIEYAGAEPPRIHIGAERDGDRWILSVHDEGIGIDADNQSRVFEVFESLHSPDDHEGIGIGLALCERIVERHGGEIWLESDPGEGTTVSVSLPVANS